MDVRAAQESETALLAQIWYDGWHEAHARIVPAEITRQRTLESFRDRLLTQISNTRVVGSPRAPVGFCMLKGHELYQLYVSAPARGTGAAAALVADAEGRIGKAGARTAWLACAIGNDRAARFYERCGWRRIGTMVYHAETPNGSVPLEVWRYEKALAP